MGPVYHTSHMTLHLDAVHLREIRLPLATPFVTSAGRVDTRRLLLLELVDASGARSWSECVALERPTYTPETVDTARLALREWLVPRVLGRSFDHPADVHRALTNAARGHAMARAALEMGCWGLLAEMRGAALAELAMEASGADGERRAVVATGVVLGMAESVDALVAKARSAVDAGYRRLKIKIGPGHDLEPLAALRAALGPEVVLWADANSAYHPADADHLARLDPLALGLLEQPLAWDDLRRHAELRRRLATPICLDESLDSLARVEDMLALGEQDDDAVPWIVNLKAGRVGGWTEALAIHDLCASRGIPLWHGGMLESGIGRAYNVALASLPGFDLPGDLSPSARYWQRDLVTPEWTMDPHGDVAVPRGTGLGVEVDGERIAAMAVWEDVLRA